MSAVRPAPLLVKIDDAASARPRRAAAANYTTARDAPPSAGPPPQPRGSRRRARRPAQRPAAEEQGAKKHGCVHQRSAATRDPAGAAARAQPHGYSLRPLSRRSACRGRALGVSLGVLDSRICEVIFVRGSGVKTLDDLDAGLWDLLLVLKWLPWLPRACRRNQGPSRGRSRKLA